MGTSQGNYGRAMYEDPEWKKAISEGLLKRRIKVEKVCPKCGKIFTIFRIKINGEICIPKKEKKFCSTYCAHSRTFTKKQKEDISKKLQKYKPTNCLECDKVIEKPRKTQKFCCRKCAEKHRKIKNRDKLEIYRRDCAFKFNLTDYPKEFNFSLIEQYGWYKPSNNGDNLGGISRDHIISVRYGFDNSISPDIISHPANCQLLIHNDNISKYTKNGMELKELEEKIKKWDNKYK